MSLKSFTARQGQYLAFIDAYTRVHGRPPAETDMQRHFQLSPPSVHQMVLTLERLGHIPTPGEWFEHQGWRLEVTEVDKRRVAAVQVRRGPARPAELPR